MQSLHAQEKDTINPTSVDPRLLEWENAKVPKEYTISHISISGIKYLDTAIVLSISGLQTGEKITHPGGNNFSKAISNLWRQKLFSGVQIYVTAIDGDNISIELSVQERARLGNFKFIGVKKSDAEDLTTKIQLTKQTIITENTRRRAVEVITKFYADKGYKNVKVRIEEKADPQFANSNSLTFYVDRGKKVKINDVNFFGNQNISGLKLKKQMKGTKETGRLTLYPMSDKGPYGSRKKETFKEYLKDFGFLSGTKTLNFLDPYFRFKFFNAAKFDQKKYDEDKEKVLEYYNSQGYRDAQIIGDTVYTAKNGNLNVDLKVDEGRKYYFGKISWKGNSKYSDSILNVILGISKGDIYNIATLNKRLGKQLSQDGNDISQLYQDDGYLFFHVEPVETAVYNDTIDHEIRISEGPQARIKNVTISGNDVTKDHVIRRELRTIPGDLFNRSEIVRSQRELGQLQFFNQETILPVPVPNQEDGTVDINWKVEEKSSNQLELSAGWGGGIGLTGTLGVTFNNFSIKNIWNKKAWDPLPQGDGQKLSLRYQSNGRAFRSYNFSFTEPWLGGKKRNSLTVSVYSSKFSNAIDYLTGRIDKKRSDTNYLKTLGVSLSLGKQLKWPDDYFSLIYQLNYQRYKLKNYNIFPGLTNGISTNVSLKITLARNSAGPNPIFPTSGSNFILSAELTPPYSLFKDAAFYKNQAQADQYKLVEFHKERFTAEWYVPIGQGRGPDKNKQFILKAAAKYGFLSRYSNKTITSPFERFQLGDAGLSNNYGLLGYDIISHRGYPVYDNSDPKVNPDISSASNFFTIFNKYTLELRYPFSTSASSTIYGEAFFEAANGWYSFKDYNPFKLRRSVGVGMRFFLPMFGLLGFDYGVGLDRINSNTGLKGAAKFTFMLGQEPE